MLSLLSHQSIAVRVRNELGRIYHSWGDLEKALAYYEVAFIHLFPEEEDAAP